MEEGVVISEAVKDDSDATSDVKSHAIDVDEAPSVMDSDGGSPIPSLLRHSVSADRGNQSPLAAAQPAPPAQPAVPAGEEQARVAAGEAAPTVVRGGADALVAAVVRGAPSVEAS
eukprot:PLAT4351.1.p1 GENE.PLAT4351.1~~PLAT4351.1.p1  ORF type:complete len:131 (-),score=23.17 PLAT4351.1:394-738(-)